MQQVITYRPGSTPPRGSARIPVSALRMRVAQKPCGTDVEFTCLHPGGMTQDAEPGVSRFLHASSPEPVIGYGGTKGVLAYYRAVLHFGTTPDYNAGAVRSGMYQE
jgi:hypothetical protein